MQIPIRLLDIEGEGFHVMIQGKINGMEANFLIDTGASRSVFDPTVITKFIENPNFEKKEGITAGVEMIADSITLDSAAITATASKK